MKHSNLDTYAKKTFDKLTLDPKKESWDVLCAKMETFKKKRRKKAFYTKIAMIICMVLLCHGYLDNKIWESRKTVSMVFEGAVGVTDTELLSTIRDDKMKKDITANKPISIPIKKQVFEPVEKKRFIGKERIQTNNDNSSLTVKTKKQGTLLDKFKSPEKVTDVELDALLLKAKQLNEREDNLLRVQQLQVERMLVNAEKEINRSKKGNFYKQIKKGYTKLKAVMAN
ncbi:hypothetical protein [Costertonia aggregata]|uniref:Uncharacterized protein n=1 Tax=Costertonia aggregata TaxID=343403 RepID=A0A7H9AKF3_9FLAO|nr:hypothetical protein [Costertonia aggregata]QLG43962.1 hypothetical protein HYG79_00890 [Costertonia aggregata]